MSAEGRESAPAPEQRAPARASSPTLARAGGVLLALMGASGLGFGAFVALRGAEADLPSPEVSLEGVLEEGPLVASPVGDPFLYGEIRVADQPGPTAPHHAGDYGDPEVRVRTAAGDVVDVRLGPSREWRLDPARRERREGIHALGALPIVHEVQTEGRLNPPFILTAKVVRPGDDVLLEVSDGVAIRTYVGTRERHERLHREREAMRWPMVALLLVLGVVSLVGGARIFRGGLSDEPEIEANA